VKITDTELQYIAYGGEMGQSYDEITASVTVSSYVVRKILETSGENLPDRQREIFKAHREQARRQTHGARVKHAVEIETMVEDAYAALRAVVQNVQGNDRLAAETAWKILQNSGAPVFSEKEAFGTQANTQINFYQNEKTADAVLGAMKSVSELSAQLVDRPLKPVNAPDRHTTVSQAAATVDIHPVRMESPPSEGSSATQKSVEGTPASEVYDPDPHV